MNLSSRRHALRLGGGGILGATLGLLAGCSAPTDGSAPTPGGERILALGDSYTIGTSVDPDERWVTKLAEKRRAAEYTVADPTIVAENGWTTADLHEGIDDAELADQYDLVTLLIGANNCFQEERPGEFRPTFAKMVERALGFAVGPERLLVISIPNYTLTPVGQQNQPQEHATRLNAYNSIIRDEVAAVGTRFVDVVPPSEMVGSNPDLIAEDDLHPSGGQYDRWLKRIYPDAVAALEVS